MSSTFKCIIPGILIFALFLAGCDSPFFRNALNPYDMKVAGLSPTVRAMLDRGALNCGVSTGVEGFSLPDQNGNWAGFDVDFCRALAAVIFDDSDAVNFVPLGANERFSVLLNEEIDILSRNTTWTLTRDTLLGLGFAGITFYDGQGFIVPTTSSVRSAEDLQGTAICVLSGTTTELNLADYFRERGWNYEPVLYDTEEPMMRGFLSGRCVAMTADQAKLFALRAQSEHRDAMVVLPDTISKEPIGPVVRDEDQFWYDIVQWTLFALLNAEELSVNSANVDAQLNSDIPSVRRLLGQEANLASGLGLPNDWVVRAIRQVGNYEEIYERHLGQDGLGIERRMNNLWTNGGLMYAPPMR